MDRATVPDNISALKAAIRVRAKLLGTTPKEVLMDFLKEGKYDQFLKLEATAEALCLAWGIDPLEEQEST